MELDDICLSLPSNSVEKTAPDFISQRLFYIPTEYYVKAVLPFSLPPGHMARLDFAASLTIRLGSIIDVGQCNMVHMMPLLEKACMYISLRHISLLALLYSLASWTDNTLRTQRKAVPQDEKIPKLPTREEFPRRPMWPGRPMVVCCMSEK